MSEDAHEVCVTLLVWQPVDADAPGEVVDGWPQVLQVHEGSGAWRAPSTGLRIGERVMEAAGRIAHAIGLTLPNSHRVLAVDQLSDTPDEAERLVIVVDGGWVTGADADVADGGASPCAHVYRHRRRWACVDDLADERTLSVALAAAVAKLPPFVIG
ncbi:hypothetical protein ACMA1D_14410 [Streptomyces sp. 796.1]|uniref:hypothetical protein n=1 Tax=Streptomyces sp. 796.1 TaxID=3163029 RepID=UPI0039C92550